MYENITQTVTENYDIAKKFLRENADVLTNKEVASIVYTTIRINFTLYKTARLTHKNLKRTRNINVIMEQVRFRKTLQDL